MATPLLDVKNLRVTFRQKNRRIKAVDGLNLSIEEGEIFGLIGESGSGKSVTSLSIMGLLDANAKIEASWIKLKDQNLLTLTEKEMRQIRGNKISMIFQDPMTSLNPSITVGSQIEESLLVHQGMPRAQARDRTCELMELLAIPHPQDTRNRFPHEFSGGMRQRVMIAMALSCDPALLIADEPTTALDVTIQAQILDLIKRLVSKLRVSVLLITHDFGVVAELCKHVSIIYGGNIVEHGPLEVILMRPKHPYTIGLLECIIPIEKEVENLEMIPGAPPDPARFPSGCKFHPRCRFAQEVCSGEMPELKEIEPGHFVRCDHA